MTGVVSWDRGIALTGHGLWLDPLTVRDLAFVSHAHSDHARRHRVALMTPATLALLPERRRPRHVRPLPLGQAVQLGAGSATLFDAGHMLGSAQMLLDLGGMRILYSGDLKLHRGRGFAPTPIPKADLLVVESTYGRPHFRFPDPDSVTEEIGRWCRRTLERGSTPVLLAHAVGKAQELLAALGAQGLRFALEERCVPAARAYEAAGQALPDWVPLGADPGDRVVIAPPAGKQAIRRLARYHTALVSGWAQEPGFWRVFGADRAFALSDHCDFGELLEVVRLSGAPHVYTVHGFSEDLARQLRRRGVRAHALHTSEQLALAI